MVRHNNQLPTNLPQLQNLLKRDPASYRDEVNPCLSPHFIHCVTTFGFFDLYFQFMQQYRHYKSTKLVFEMKPDQNNKGLDDLVMFLAQVGSGRCAAARDCTSFWGFLNIYSIILGRALLPQRSGWISPRTDGYLTETSYDSQPWHAKSISNSP